jgi:hypothetical protein
MTATFGVQNIAEITCTGMNPTDAELLNTSIDDMMATPPVLAATLGTIKVRTNVSSWDVVMRTRNGGRMAAPGIGTDDVCITDVWGVEKCEKVPKAGNVLTYSTKTGTAGTVFDGIIQGGAAERDTVQLQVAIALGRPGFTLGAPSANTVYPIGSPTAPDAIRKIPATAINNSSDRFGGTGDEISFAKILGLSYAGTNPTSLLDWNGRTWADIQTGGFAVPKTETAPSSGVFVTEDYFIVSVGILKSKKDELAGNPNGVYSETFIFDLCADY